MASSSHSMGLIRPPMLVASVFTMTFLWSTEANPTDCSPDGGTDVVVGTETDGDIEHLLTLINPRNAVGARGWCVPFHRCCDKTDSGNEEENPFLGLIDVRTGTAVSAIGHNKCGGKLKLCCACVNDEAPKPKILNQKPQCGKRNVDGVGVRVIGFEERQTQQGEFPWMVAVMFKNTTYVGGGSLVHPKVVLTAAHKVHNRNPDNLMARMGDWDLNDQIESIAPQNIDVVKILHPNNEFENVLQSHNVALLILKTEAVFGATVAPVCLPEPGQNFDGKNCFVTGWGKTEVGGNDYQTIMKKVEVPIVGRSECQTTYQAYFKANNAKFTFFLSNHSTCAGGGMEDACEGDGGSPLVCPGDNPDQLVQVGVVSWGIKCGVVGRPGVYESVPNSMDWISQTIKNET